MAVTRYIYPTDTELAMIAQDLLPRLQTGRVIFDPGFFPIVNVDSHLLEWEQMDDYIGLQQARGLNGRPSQVRPTGGQRFQVEPGVYGEFEPIDEREITTRRPWGQFAGRINIDDLVMMAQVKLLKRRLDRVELIAWQLVQNGVFSVPAPNGAIVHYDTFQTQTYDVGVGWGTLATATPLADLRAVNLMSRGHSVSFGSQAKAYMNQVTFNRMMSNTNPADLGGRRDTLGATINGPEGVTRILTMDGLPTPVIYDKGYKDDNGVWQLFIPDNKVTVVGARDDGSKLGEYRMTRNANNPGVAPGAYTRVIDRDNEIPRSVEVHDGHNGGPVIYFPSAIVVMDVS